MKLFVYDKLLKAEVVSNYLAWKSSQTVCVTSGIPLLFIVRLSYSLSFSLTNSCCEKHITHESNNENACCSHPKRNSWQSIWLMSKINDDATAISKQLVYYFMRSFDSLWNAWEQANCWNAQIQPTPVKKADCFVTPTSWATLTFCFHWRQIFREY